VIRFENLTKAFDTDDAKKVVLDGLTLSLPPGRSIALLGRNGAGKSTLLQLIAGNQKPMPGAS
jgi:capsular polysaccharide transport system ATP-binding protein